MRILGIDPGLQRTGFAVVAAQGARVAYVASGVIATAEAARADLPARLKIIVEGVREVVATYGPDCAAVEIVFVNTNPQSTLLLGQARGAAIAALVLAGLPVAEYTALQVKKSVVGHGHAAKSQVQAMVQRLLALPGLPGPDAADALAVALTHAHAGPAIAAARSAAQAPAQREAPQVAPRVARGSFRRGRSL